VLAVAGLTAAVGLGLAAPAAAHDSLAATIDAKADYLRYKASRLTYATVLDSTQKATLQARLRDTAADLDAIAAQALAADTEAELDAAYDAYRAELTASAPTLRATRQAFYGTALRAKSSYLREKAATLEAKLDVLETGGDISAEDAAAVQAAITAARAKIALARAALVPAVLGVRIMTDPDAASSTLYTAAKRLYGAKWWLGVAASALYHA
jgi:hypothetical protein